MLHGRALPCLFSGFQVTLLRHYPNKNSDADMYAVPVAARQEIRDVLHTGKNWLPARQERDRQDLSLCQTRGMPRPANVLLQFTTLPYYHKYHV